MTQGVFARIDRDVVVAAGPDATSFLQSLVSQDLDPVDVGQSAHALLLEPKGKLVVDMRAAHVADDEWWLVCEAGFGPVLEQGLNRFKIRVKVELEDRSAALTAIAVRSFAADVPIGMVSVRNDWPDAPGVEIVGERSAIDELAANLAQADVAELDADAYEALRVEAGSPRQGYDIDESTIAQEAFLERDAVSFTKGCFLGQELVCRIDSRGNVTRLLRRLRSDAPLARGAEVVADGKGVGTVTSVAGNVALATIRRVIEPGTDVVVRIPAGDVTARIEAVAAGTSSETVAP